MPQNELYRKVMNYLSLLIKENRDVPNYKLPSERYLTIKFKISRHPIRLAYSKLIQQELVENIPGKGYFIKNVSGANDLLNTEENNEIYFIIPSIKSRFTQEVISGAENFCDEHNLSLSIKVTDDNFLKEKKFINAAKLSLAKGIILFPLDNEKYNDELLKLALIKFPVTIVDRYIHNLNFAFISTDGYNAMINAVYFLKEKNYKNIVYITPPASSATTSEERINGYNHGLLKYYGATKPRDLLKITNNTQERIKSVKNYLLKYPETEVAIITGSYATEVITAANELNISIPEKLKLMIFDDELSSTENSRLKPYIIQQDGKRIGYLAAEYVYKQISGSAKIMINKLPAKIYEYENE